MYIEYESNPELRDKRLAAIRKKYAHRIRNTKYGVCKPIKHCGR